MTVEVRLVVVSVALAYRTFDSPLWLCTHLVCHSAENRRTGRKDIAAEVPPEQSESTEAATPAEEPDLLDVNNWDDVVVEPQQGPVVSPPGAAPFGYPPQPPPQSYDPASNPYGAGAMAPQQLSYATAMVPVSGPPQGYPGAPPPPQQQSKYNSDLITLTEF